MSHGLEDKGTFKDPFQLKLLYDSDSMSRILSLQLNAIPDLDNLIKLFTCQCVFSYSRSAASFEMSVRKYLRLNRRLRE